MSDPDFREESVTNADGLPSDDSDEECGEQDVDAERIEQRGGGQAPAGRSYESLTQHAKRLEAIVDSSSDPIVLKDLAGRYQFVNDAAADYVGLPKSDIVGSTDPELFGEPGREIRRYEKAVMETETDRTFEVTLPGEDGDERVFENRASPYYDPDGELAGTFAICKDVTERKVRDQTLESQRNALATLNRINEVVRAVISVLIGEANREEIEQAVCDRIVESDLYEVAWVGQPNAATGEIRGLVGAGIDDSIRSLVDGIDVSEDSDEAVAKAYHTGETQVVARFGDEAWSAASDLRQDSIVDQSDRSGIAVPIRYGDTTYGVLAVESTRPSAFSDREADAFDVLGELIGFAINAVMNRRLALSDTVVELEFELDDPNSVYVALSEQLGCSLRLEGMATGPDGSLVFYDTMWGADPEELIALAAEWDTVESVRLVSQHEDEYLLEFTVSGSSFVLTLSEYGAKTSEAITERGTARVVAELPPDTDVREVVEQVREEYPSAELVAKREREREVHTAREF
ncbi:bacterio-opsin activator domain-containing protein [Halorussus halophilus]|uniref:bacterio-opsin activator domain-containing protein n=1 Tax=Halorussus halophilus TaxID=2650975 RepID=UPI0013016AD1|nr:bacterio-opsin activator domain-containing protein [Halorussus halophilus]